MATEDVLGELGGLAAIKAMESWPAQPPSAAETQCRQAISSRLNALLSGGDLAHGQLAEIEELSCALCVLIARLRATATAEVRPQLLQAVAELHEASEWLEKECCLTWHPVFEASDAGFALSAIFLAIWGVEKATGMETIDVKRELWMLREKSRFPVDDPPAEEVQRFPRTWGRPSRSCATRAATGRCGCLPRWPASVTPTSRGKRTK